MPSFCNNTGSYCQLPTPPQNYDYSVDSAYGSSQLNAKQAADLGKVSPQTYYSLRPKDAGLATKLLPQYLPGNAPRSMQLADFDPRSSLAFWTHPPSTDQLPPVGAPQLAPTRMPINTSHNTHPNNQAKRSDAAAPSKKEEKIGGVAAQLDYEMDEMVDFVSEKAKGMFDLFTSSICLEDIDLARSALSFASVPTREFRKYVLQVLSATRLPSSTILLGLLYMAKRMALLSQRIQYSQRFQGLHSMLTIALVLGSKFLDDNTFQNRSWSEVSNIALNEINHLEFQWLGDIQWDMHIDQDDPEGFRLWLNLWQKHQARSADTVLTRSMNQTHLGRPHQPRNVQPLPPLDTQLLYARNQISLEANFANQDPGLWNTPQHFHWPQLQPRSDYSPPSAPETATTTPDIFTPHDSYVYGPQIIHPSLKLPSARELFSHRLSPDFCPPYDQRYNCYGPGFYENNACRPNSQRPYVACAY